MFKRQILRLPRFRPTCASIWGFIMDSTTLLPSRTSPFSTLHGSAPSSTNAAASASLSLKGCFSLDFNKRFHSGAVRNRGGGALFSLRPQSLQNFGQDFARPGNPLGLPYHPKFEKALVAVDVDEVLGNFVSALNRFIADRYSLNHSVSEYHVYEFFKIWKCSRDEADIRVHEFFKTPYFKTGIHPIPGAREALDKLAKFCNLCVVTSRQNTIKDHTIDWLETHYPGLFRDIHFGNHFALDGESRRKSDICRSVGAQYLIDDNPRYAIECAEAGIGVLLFDYENSYSWCKSDEVDQHPLITRVRNWEEVEQQLISWIAA